MVTIHQKILVPLPPLPACRSLSDDELRRLLAALRKWGTK